MNLLIATIVEAFQEAHESEDKVSEIKKEQEDK